MTNKNNVQDIAYKDRTIILNNVIDEMFEEHLLTLVLNYNRRDDNLSAREPITLMINSPGGYVSQSLSISNTIFKSKTPVITINAGLAASGASLVLISGQRRFAYENSYVMLHSLKGGSWGVSSNVTRQSKYLENLDRDIETIYKSRTKMPKNFYKDIFDRHLEIYLSAKEALKFGLVDEII